MVLCYTYVQRRERRDFVKTLYLTDLDGTLLNDDTKLSDKTIQIINSLVEQGEHISFATARSMISAQSVIKGLNLKDGVIVYNGVYILEPSSKKILHERLFSKEEAQMLLELFVQHGLHPFVYTYIDGVEKVLYEKHEFHEGAANYRYGRKNDPRFMELEDGEDLLQGDVFYFTIIDDKENLDDVYDILENTYSFMVIYQKERNREEYWLEVMPKKASKADAMLRLKEKEGFDEVICFGDAANDIEMFKASDACYAVSNAIDEIKEIADGIIGSNNEDAVALWIQQDVERKKKNVYFSNKVDEKI